MFVTEGRLKSTKNPARSKRTAPIILVAASYSMRSRARMKAYKIQKKLSTITNSDKNHMSFRTLSSGVTTNERRNIMSSVPALKRTLSDRMEENSRSRWLPCDNSRVAIPVKPKFESIASKLTKANANANFPYSAGPRTLVVAATKKNTSRRETPSPSASHPAFLRMVFMHEPLYGFLKPLFESIGRLPPHFFLYLPVTQTTAGLLAFFCRSIRFFCPGLREVLEQGKNLVDVCFFCRPNVVDPNAL